MSGVYKFSFFFLVENVYFRSLKYVNIFSSSKRKEEQQGESNQQQQGESNWTNKSGIKLNWTPLLPPPPSIYPSLLPLIPICGIFHLKAERT